MVEQARLEVGAKACQKCKAAQPAPAMELRGDGLTKSEWVGDREDGRADAV
jgi:hypothetical protein